MRALPAAMSAVAPPPVGSEAEPSVTADNDNAISALRRSHVCDHGVGAPLRQERTASLVALLAVGIAAALVATVGARVNTRKQSKLWRRLRGAPSRTARERALGLAWTPLYALSVLSSWRAWRTAAR